MRLASGVLMCLGTAPGVCVPIHRGLCKRCMMKAEVHGVVGSARWSAERCWEPASAAILFTNGPGEGGEVR
jgi:hypothetical protein